MRTCVSLSAVLWLAASAGWAVDWKSFKPQGYISDFAGVVDPSSKAQVEAYGAELQRATGAQIALVTIPTLQGEPLSDVAQLIARAWGVGQGGGNQGILLLLSIGDRRSRLEIGDGLRPISGDLEGSLRREMRPALREQQYGEAMMAAAETIGGAIARARNVRLNLTLPRHLRPTVANSVPWPFVLFGIAELVLLGMLIPLAVRRAGGGQRAFRPTESFVRSPALVLPSGTQSGGGFGSYDSSDSFGGFGGGDGAPSGPGGRASCDW
jgi:uncharacterized protein